MKTTLLLLLLSAFTTHCLSQSSYAQFGALGSLYKNNGHALGGEFDLNFTHKDHSLIGVGVAALSFKDFTGAYIPIYGRFGGTINAKSAIITIHADAGYGLYNQQYKYGSTTSSTKGGFYFSPGVSFRGKNKISPYLDFRYSLYKFKSTIPLADGSLNINAITASLGIAIINSKR